MSLFIKVQRIASPLRLFRLRKLSCHFGEDAHGVLTENNPKNDFFTVYTFGEKYAISSQKSDLIFDGEPLTPDRLIWLEDESVLTVGDYKFLFLQSSSSSEALAQTNITIEELDEVISQKAEMRQVKYGMADLSRSFPLFPNIELTIGSNPDCAIFLDVPGTLGNYGTLKFDGNKIAISPLVANAISINHESINKNVSLDLPKSIQLNPPGLELQFL